MTAKRKFIIIVLTVSIIGIILWIGLDAVMRGVTEMEKNMRGARKAVKDDRIEMRDN